MKARRNTGRANPPRSSSRISVRATKSAEAGPPRDFGGYGAHPPDAAWPGGARIAVNLNLNVEAGGEHCLLEGDDASEAMLTDIGFPSYKNTRSPMVELVFEYGPRAGCWRLLRIFKRFDIKVSILGVVRGLQQYPELAQAFVAEGHEIVSHGWRWLDYHHMPVDEERSHIRLAFERNQGAGRRAAGRLVQRPPEHQYPPSRDRTRRLSLRPRLSRRRIAVLGQARRARPSGHTVLVRDQRQPFRPEQRLQYRRRVRQIPERLLRSALRRRRGRAENDEHLAARPADRPAGQGGRLDQVPRTCPQARSGLVLYRQRYREHWRRTHPPRDYKADRRCRCLECR